MKPITFFTAEAPGGFIQGSNIYLQLNNNITKVLKKTKIYQIKMGLLWFQKKKRPEKL
jgi:hypothetical protein